jgi:hypothetical protein
MVGLLMGILQDLEREGTSSAGGAGKAILQQLSIYELVLRGWGGEDRMRRKTYVGPDMLKACLLRLEE